MLWACGAILRLYPAKYRRMFGGERVDVLRSVRNQAVGLGPFPATSFYIRELTGLLTGLTSEWLARLASGDAYLSGEWETQHSSDCPVEDADLQKRLTHLIRCMEFAIAHHDFPKARYYSEQERLTRAELQKAIPRRA